MNIKEIKNKFYLKLISEFPLTGNPVKFSITTDFIIVSAWITPDFTQEDAIKYHLENIEVLNTLKNNLNYIEFISNNSNLLKKEVIKDQLNNFLERGIFIKKSDKIYLNNKYNLNYFDQMDIQWFNKISVIYLNSGIKESCGLNEIINNNFEKKVKFQFTPKQMEN